MRHRKSSLLLLPLLILLLFVVVVVVGTTIPATTTTSATTTTQDNNYNSHSSETAAAATSDGTTCRSTSSSSSNEEAEGGGEGEHQQHDNDTKTDDWCRLAVQDGRCVIDLKDMIEQQCSEACLQYSDDLGTIAVMHNNNNKNNKNDNICLNHEEDALCEDFVAQHECIKNPQYMYDYCRQSCWMCSDFSETKRIERVMGVPQHTKPPTLSSSSREETTTRTRIQERFLTTLVDTQHYLETVVLIDAHYQSVRRTGCYNHDPYCTWHVAQQTLQQETHDDEDEELFCDILNNQIRCGPACQSCAALLFSPNELHTLHTCTPDPATNLLRDDTTTTTMEEEDDEEENADERITLDTMFRRMLGEVPYPSAYAEHVPTYNVTVISRPSLHPETHSGKAYHELDFVVGGPWILVLDNFLTDEDCDQLIAWGDTIGRQASTFVNDGVDDDDEDDDDDDDNYEDDCEDDDNYEDDDDDDDDDDNYDDQEKEHRDDSKFGEDKNNQQEQVGKDEETSTTETKTDDAHDDDDDDDDDNDDTDDDQWRTSTTAWCSEQSCGADPIVRDIERKIGLTTSVVNTAYFEHLQLLKYVGGQYYKHHHDESAGYHNEPYDTAGPRIVTFFLYLNDVGESGGGAGGGGGGATRFTDILGDESNIHVEVQPKRGRAVVWPSMRNQDLLDFEERTFHEARPVEHGHVKYGANMWLHLRPFRTSGCDDEALMRITNTLDMLQHQYPHLDDDDDEE